MPGTGKAHTGNYGLAAGGFVKLYNEATDTVDGVIDTITESEDAPGCYFFSNPTLVGLYRVDFYDAGAVEPFWYGWAILTTSGSFTCEDSKQLAIASAGVIVSAFTDAALAVMKSTLSAVVIRVRGPVFVGDDESVSITLAIGDDYSATDGRAIDFDFDGTELPDLTGAAASLVCTMSNPKPRTVTFAGSLTDPTGPTRTVRFQPTSDETSSLRVTADGEFYIAFTLPAGRRITPEGLRGSLIVLPSKLIEC